MRRLFPTLFLLACLSGFALAQGANVTPTDGTTVDNPQAEIGVTFLVPVIPSASRIYLNGADITSRATCTDSQVRFIPQQLTPGKHKVRVTARAASGATTFDLNWSFSFTGQSFNPTPANGATASSRRPVIGATFYDPVKTTTVRLYVDGQDVTGMCKVSNSQVSCQPGADMKSGQHSARVTASAESGKSIDNTWYFYIP
ncbi:MAG: hypothetical protein AMXMBFR33_16110 [Candidatus Xenobia bacterium]